MKKIPLLFALFVSFCFIIPAVDAQVASLRDSLGGAPVPEEIEDPEIFAINREPAHDGLTKGSGVYL